MISKRAVAAIPLGAILLGGVALASWREGSLHRATETRVRSVGSSPSEFGTAPRPIRSEERPARETPPFGLGKSAALPAALRLARSVAVGDPEMTARMREELNRWLSDLDGAVRNRAETILAELEMGWEAAATSHPDPRVRRSLLEQPPDGSERTVALLLRSARGEADPECRAAALGGLPSRLENPTVGEYLADPIPSVARAAVAVLRSARAIDAGTLASLKALAFSDSEVAPQARRALLRHARSLTEEEQVRLEAVLLQGG